MLHLWEQQVTYSNPYVKRAPPISTDKKWIYSIAFGSLQDHSLSLCLRSSSRRPMVNLPEDFCNPFSMEFFIFFLSVIQYCKSQSFHNIKTIISTIKCEILCFVPFHLRLFVREIYQVESQDSHGIL
ncbi:Hypothetical predicted protein [Marmota monax]|uniref:Uncharacterized protein n=1 Tax=Marmota monax TaxID=9995 RepID=A0A5E4CVN4_MARMO|nr:hypothetical protein GHT09_017893 [Marmota monax]VTJ85795.1 Hypothetical predicted protein [Marmota monax]